MLIDATNLATHTFTPVRSKDSIDSTEVAAFLNKIATSIEEGNRVYTALQRHAESQARTIKSAKSHIAKLEAIPSPTERQLQAITMAEELHDRYVVEGQAAAAEIVSAAHTEAARIVEEARAAGAQIMEDISDKKNTVERRIEKLSQFERDNWIRIQAFLQGQISNLGTKIPESLVPPAETETELPEED